MKIKILLCSLFSVSIVWGQNSTSTTVKNKQDAIQELDKKILVLEHKIDNRDSVQIKTYQEILEKTNNQLSLWTNPYGIAVGTLSALLGFLAIGVTFLLYKQSTDHKQQISEEKTEREIQFKKFLADWSSTLQSLNAHISQSKEEYDGLISDQKEKLKNANPQETEELKKQIEELKRAKAEVPSDLSKTVMANWPTLDSLSMLGAGPRVHKCNSCGFGFRVKNLNKGFTFSAADRAEVTCPKCGNIDLL